jgi:hypothetical protein
MARKLVVELTDPNQLANELASSSLKSHLEMVSSKVLDEIKDNEQHFHEILDLIIQCAGCLGYKTSAYAALTCLISQKMSSSSIFGTKLIEKVFETLEKDLFSLQNKEEDEEEVQGIVETASSTTPTTSTNATKPPATSMPNLYLRIRLLVRFLGQLVSFNLFKAEDFITNVLEPLQSITESEESEESEESVGNLKDFFAFVLLETILHVSLNDRWKPINFFVL